MHIAGLNQPVFKFDGMFSVVIERKKSSGKSSDIKLNNIKSIVYDRSGIKVNNSALQIIEFLLEDVELTIPEMSNKLKITERAVEKNIRKLKDLGIIERKNGDKGGFWQVLIDFSI